MIDPRQTVRAILLAMNDEEATQHDYQQALVSNEDAIRQVQQFSASVSHDAMRMAANRGADTKQALSCAAESAIIAVLLLGIEYGRMLEKDQVQSLEAMLANLEGGDAHGEG